MAKSTIKQNSSTTSSTEIIKVDDKGNKIEWNEIRYDYINKITVTWKYRGDRSKGPYEVEIDYPEDFKTEHELIEENNLKVPKSKRKYFNPNTGDYVGYTRAFQLGLVK